MHRLVWFALLAACARPAPATEPITAHAVASDAKPTTALPIAGHERVQFEPNATDIAPTELAALDSVVRRMTADSALALQISGHTDPSELDANNTGGTGLSYLRANAVHNYLVAHGIADSRLAIHAVGAGEPSGDHVNRRVEFERVTIKVHAGGGRVVVTDTDVHILDPITFGPGNDVLTKTSYPALDAVVATLNGNPSIVLVEVQSHTDERGDAAVNQRLTDARALVVMNYLVGKGVDRARLVAQGYGSTQPLDAHHTEAAWAKNTRIAFLVLKRAP